MLEIQDLQVAGVAVSCRGAERERSERDAESASSARARRVRTM